MSSIWSCWCHSGFFPARRRGSGRYSHGRRWSGRSTRRPSDGGPVTVASICWDDLDNGCTQRWAAQSPSRVRSPAGGSWWSTMARPGPPTSPCAPRSPSGARCPKVRWWGLSKLPRSHCWPRTCLHWGWIRGDTYLDPLILVGAGPVRLMPLQGLPSGSGRSSAPGVVRLPPLQGPTPAACVLFRAPPVPDWPLGGLHPPRITHAPGVAALFRHQPRSGSSGAGEASGAVSSISAWRGVSASAARPGTPRRAARRR